MSTKQAVVIRQKKLFQAPPVDVAMGSSATNCHAYSVFVSGVKFVVCSNDWTPKKQLLPVEDQAWLDHNSIVLKVEDRMY